MLDNRNLNNNQLNLFASHHLRFQEAFFLIQYFVVYKMNFCITHTLIFRKKNKHWVMTASFLTHGSQSVPQYNDVSQLSSKIFMSVFQICKHVFQSLNVFSMSLWRHTWFNGYCCRRWTWWAVFISLEKGSLHFISY